MKSSIAKSKSPLRLGIDLGGTKIEAVLLDQNGSVIFQQRTATPASDYRAILSAVQQLVMLAEGEAGQKLAVGLGTPGAISPKTGLLRNSNTVCMNGRNLYQDLQQLLQRPLRIQNDANCFALSEAMDGAAEEFEMVFGVIIGTGTGGGIVYNKQLIKGMHRIAGEWGHNPLPWQKDYDVPRDCYCGKVGCIETYLSGPGFCQNVAALTGQELSSRELTIGAENGDPFCQQQMDIYYDQMARALAHLINIIDPDAIVLGGGMSNIKGIYQQVPQRLKEYVFSDYVDTRIIPPRYGDSSGVRGAAWLW